jgi:DNA primase
MAASLDDVKQRIKARVPLDQLIGETVTLVRRGTSLTACCPFHAEKSPSFHIYPDNHYYCFGCKETGDAITFVRKTREFSFIESLKFLAGKYGIDAPELDESDTLKRRRGEQAALTQMMVAAQELFASELTSPRGRDSVKYLQDRGFSAENITLFGFGLTPAEGFGLSKHLRSLGYREDDMIRASLSGLSAQSGRPYDFFRDRIMIPIRDVQGRVIAFGGRTITNDPAKYKNSGATPLFDKSGVLFGLNHSRDSIKDKRRAIIVEGYMDTLALWQSGIHEVVASMGTALTVRQLKLLCQQTKTPEAIVLFDGDNAGQKATLSAVEVVLEVPELRVRAAKLEGGDDPDTFVRKHGADALRDVLSNAVDLMDLAIGSKLNGVSQAALPSIVGNDFVPWLSKVQDPLKRGYLVNRVSGLTGVPADVINRRLRSFSFGPQPTGRSTPTFGSQTTRPAPAGEESNAVEAPLLLPSRALTPVEKGVLGHIYFAEAGEIDPGKVDSFIAKELALEPLWELFSRKVTQSYQKGLSPRNDPLVLAAFSPEEVTVLASLTDMAPASFATSDRNGSIDRLITEQSRNNIKQSIALLKRQVQIAVSQSPQDVPKFLSEVMILSQNLASLDRPI